MSLWGLRHRGIRYQLLLIGAAVIAFVAYAAILFVIALIQNLLAD